MQTQYDNIKDLVSFFNQNKKLTHRQQTAFTTFIVRDYNDKGGMKETQDKGNLESAIGGLTYHDPMKVVRFLHQFTEYKCKALKYTTHFWDKNPSTNEYDFASFDQFKEAYKLILEKGDNKLSEIRPLCPHLWQIVNNFLIRDDAVFPWSEHKLRIGYNQYLKEWMDKNPGVQPFNMPLDELPEDLRPKGKIKGKTLVYFNDVVNIFKNCIEFRDNALYYTVKEMFKSSDHNIDKNNLDTLRGISFFTDTELIKSALQTISGNILQRPDYPNIEIYCKNIKDGDENLIELKITQIGSFSLKEISDPKITGKTSNSMFAIIKAQLRNLCDFYVESVFRINGEPKDCRLRYLSSNKEDEWMEELQPSSCKGFTYVMKFKTYNNNE